MEPKSETPSHKLSKNDETKSQKKQETLSVVDTIEKEVEGRSSPWISLWIANLISFLSAIQFTVFFSSLYPYLELVDDTANQSYFGWVIAAYSIGQAMASPLFGWWSNKIQQTRLPLASGVVILIIGNLLYCFIESFDSYRKEILLLARVIVGFGSGNISVLRAYVATASTSKDRSKAISLSTAAFMIGFAVGPGLQAAFVPLKYPGYVHGAFHFDMYTAPGYVANVANLLVFILLFTCFHESYAGIVPKETKKDPFFALPSFDLKAVILLIAAWFAQLFCQVNIETIASPYSIAMFNWSDKEAVAYNGIILFVSAIISSCVYLAYLVYLGKRVDDRISILVASGILFGFWIITYPWPGYTGKLSYQLSTTKNATFPSNTSALSIISSSGDEISSNTTSIPVWPNVATRGCKPSYDWCRTTPAIPEWLYLVFWPMLSISFPMGDVSIATLYSKVLGPRRQGTMQGFMTAAGCAARIIGPIAMSYSFEAYGPRVCWACCAVVVIIAALPWIWLYDKTFPLIPKPKLKPGQCFRYEKGFQYRF